MGEGFIGGDVHPPLRTFLTLKKIFCQCTPPPTKSKGVFSDIWATASSLNTSYGLKT